MALNKYRKMNELHKESSPYLFQHANNPIHWKACSEATLNHAKKDDKLLVISIGYSTCHWCHVMENESFNDLEVAQLMNDHFTSIKVDREEQPDIDAFYMKAVQLMTKQGGWPLNVVCLPDGRPIWGGTYFNKETWMQSLNQLHNLYQNNPNQVYEFAEKLHEGISVLSKAPTDDTESNFDLDKTIDLWKRSFDWEYGGYAKAPKFMMPNNLYYLQKLGVSTDDSTLLDYVDLTLTKMLYGGIFDTVQGGFFRYAVDFKWHIPHFEKMLYDNAQLISLYADAYKRTKNPLYKECILKSIAFIEDEWHNGEGGYFCALDADSLTAKKELKEGAFYVWTEAELKTLLRDDFTLFSQVFNINSFGHWEDEDYVLIQNQPLEKIAKKNHIALEHLQFKKQEWEKLLKQRRDKRNKPSLDDKSLTAWNAMLAIAYTDTYTALETEVYKQKAIDILTFIEQKLWDEEVGLFHTYKEGTAKIAGYLDDYAWYIAALIQVYDCTLDEAYLLKAKAIADMTLDYFLDETQGFFTYSKHKNTIFVPSIEVEDNVIPSPNSVMVHNLYKLGILFENQHYTALCEQITQTVLQHVDYPSYYSNWLLMDLYLNNRTELSIIGENALTENQAVRSCFIAHSLVTASKEDSVIPYFKSKYLKNETLFYLCKNKSCLQPTTNFDMFKTEL